MSELSGIREIYKHLYMHIYVFTYAQNIYIYEINR